MTQIGKRRKVRATIHSAHWGFLAAESERASERVRKGGRERGGEREGLGFSGPRQGKKVSS